MVQEEGFSIMPQTFLLPQEYTDMVAAHTGKCYSTPNDTAHATKPSFFISGSPH